MPNLPGCISCGENFADAIEMAIDAASGWILTSLEDGEQIPSPSKIQDISLEYENGVVNYILLDIDAYSEKYGQV